MKCHQTEGYKMEKEIESVCVVRRELLERLLARERSSYNLNSDPSPPSLKCQEMGM